MILEELFDRYLEDGNDFPETEKKMKEAMIYLKDKGIDIQKAEELINSCFLMNNWQGFVSGFSYGIMLMMEVLAIKNMWNKGGCTDRGKHTD